jgi:peptidoglycan hydrolase-like protein with peptidoglycan-binding domain
MVKRAAPALMTVAATAVLAVALEAGPASGRQGQGFATPQKPRLSIVIPTGLKNGRDRYVLKGQSVTVRGFERPFVAGQDVVVKAYRGRKRVVRKVLRIQKRARDDNGGFATSFRARKAGTLTVSAEHVGTPELAGVKTGKSHLHTIKAPRAGGGARGVRVWLLQRALRAEGYPASQSGYFDAATGRAVAAFRSVNRMSRAAYATRGVYQRLFHGTGRFPVRYPGAGKHVEFDWSRQVIALIRGSRVVKVVYTSSGKPSTPTVFGSYRFYSKTPGTNQKGMLDSNYFVGGYAIHGYPDVPSYPASHGCIRIPNSQARSVFNWISIGDKMFTYR